jgi:hypothetical protein
MLAQANNFSPEDLKQNHDGLLSAHQVNRLLRWGGYHGLMFLIGTVLLIAPFRDRLHALSAGSVLLLLGVEVIFILSFGLNAALIIADLWSGKVGSVEGTVWREAHHWTRYGRSYAYVMGSHRFHVPQAAYAALVAGRSYRIFYVPRSRRLVSIEPVEAGNVI